jgi:hypothetical protein
MEIDMGSVPEVHFQSQEYNLCAENKAIRSGFSSSAFGRAEKTGENPHSRGRGDAQKRAPTARHLRTAGCGTPGQRQILRPGHLHRLASRTTRNEHAPQDPGSKYEPGAPFASLYFRGRCRGDILCAILKPTNTNSPSPGHRPVSGWLYVNRAKWILCAIIFKSYCCA